MSLTEDEEELLVYATFYGYIEDFKKYYSRCDEGMKEIVNDILVTASFFNAYFIYRLKKDKIVSKEIIEDMIIQFKREKVYSTDSSRIIDHPFDVETYADREDINLLYIKSKFSDMK